MAIVGRNVFLQLYDKRTKSLGEIQRDVRWVIEDLRQMCKQFHSEYRLAAGNKQDEFVRSILDHGIAENNDDFDNVVDNPSSISTVRQCSNKMPKQEYCCIMRSINVGEQEIILKATHHCLHTPDTFPVQIFSTGQAGSDITYVL